MFYLILGFYVGVFLQFPLVAVVISMIQVTRNLSQDVHRSLPQ